MALSIAQLTSPPTRTDVVNWLLDRLRALGFPVTGWQEGRIANSLLNAFGTVGAIFAQQASAAVRMGFSSTGSGAGLTLHSRERFDNERDLAVKAAGGFLLTNSGTSPYTIDIGSLIVTDTSAVQFTNIEAGTLSASSTLTLDFEAVTAGADGNIPNDSTLTLVTPLAGVTVTNPGPGDVDLDGFDDPWYDTALGADEERDAALHDRNRTKWGLLATTHTNTAYQNLALSDIDVTKVRVVDDNPRGPGTVDVYVSADAAALSTTGMTRVQKLFADNVGHGTESAWPPLNTPLESTVELKIPPTVTLVVEGVVYYDPQYTQVDIEARVSQALSDLVSLTPLGGSDFAPGPVGVITSGDIVEAIERTLGVRTTQLTSPAGDFTVTPNGLVLGNVDWFTGLGLTSTAVTS